MTYDPEIEKLLPWYAKGLLGADDMAKVEGYLSAHPEMRLQLDLINEEIVAVDQQHAAMGAPAAGGLDRLMADIDALEGRKGANLASVSDGFVARVRSFFAGFQSPGMQLAGALAAVVIVAQAVVLTGLLSHHSGQPVDQVRFATASGPEQMQAQMLDGARLLIAFQPQADMGSITALLKQVKGTFVAGPKAGGFFEILVPGKALPDGGAQILVDRLKEQQSLVKFVAVTGQ